MKQLAANDGSVYASKCIASAEDVRAILGNNDVFSNQPRGTLIRPGSANNRSTDSVVLGLLHDMQLS
jgi:hypothetical protein